MIENMIPPNHPMYDRPFDAHNHVHMGPCPASWALGQNLQQEQQNQQQPPNDTFYPLGGMALQSTHPRDYLTIWNLCHTIPNEYPHSIIIPCFGVHPWWLHELTNDDWKLVVSNFHGNVVPQWIQDLEQMLVFQQSQQQHSGDDIDNNNNNNGEGGGVPPSHHHKQQLQRPPPNQQFIASSSPSSSSSSSSWIPQPVVGEIGLDKFHFDGQKGALTCPFDKQVEAFELQLTVATRLQRPVSIHCVHSMGPLMDTIQLVQRNEGRLPPAMYFHAFGGKAPSIDQLSAICTRGSKKKQQVHPYTTKIYFGFAPVINFKSPKTAEVIRKVGLERLVLETDHEDSRLVPRDMHDAIQFIAETLQVDPDTLIQQTTNNVMDLYGINR